MKITWSHIRTALIVLFVSLLGFLFVSVLAFFVINGMWHQIFGVIIWIGIVFGTAVAGEIARNRLSKRLVEKIKKADLDEQQREDEILLQAVAFSQSISFFITTLLLDGDLRIVIGTMTAVFAITFYIFRAWAKIKNSALHRYISMHILSFVGASTLMTIFALAVRSLLLTPIAIDLGLFILVPLVFGFFGSAIGDVTSGMFKKRYGVEEQISWKLMIKNFIHQR